MAVHALLHLQESSHQKHVQRSRIFRLKCMTPQYRNYYVHGHASRTQVSQHKCREEFREASGYLTLRRVYVTIAARTALVSACARSGGGLYRGSARSRRRALRTHTITRSCSSQPTLLSVLGCQEVSLLGAAADCITRLSLRRILYGI